MNDKNQIEGLKDQTDIEDSLEILNNKESEFLDWDEVKDTIWCLPLS